MTKPFVVLIQLIIMKTETKAEFAFFRLAFSVFLRSSIRHYLLLESQKTFPFPFFLANFLSCNFQY